MKESDYNKERKRRDREDEFYNCLCGAKFIGKNADYDKHLEWDCSVFHRALKNLSK